MHRQFSGNLINPVAINRHTTLADAMVNLGAPHGRHEAVRYFEVESVIEFVAGSYCSVW
jgi:hypothetical protein